MYCREHKMCHVLQLFITAMDKLRLGINANDELQPDLKELHENICRFSIVPAVCICFIKINYHIELNATSTCSNCPTDLVTINIMRDPAIFTTHHVRIYLSFIHASQHNFFNLTNLICSYLLTI